MQQQFDFINVSKPSDRLPSSEQSKIKSHAMRHVQRKRIFGPPRKAPRHCKCSRILGIGAQYQAATVAASSRRARKQEEPCRRTSAQWHDDSTIYLLPNKGVRFICNRCGCASLNAAGMDSAARHHHVSQVGPRQESFNVFAPAAAPITPRVRQLLDHFIVILTPITNPVIYGPEDKPVITKALDDILRCVTKDSACMHAISADAAWHRVGMFKKNNQMIEHNHARVEARYHWTEAVRLLQVKLQDRHEHKSEWAIIAMRHLGTLSITQGGGKSPQHHKLLAKMVTDRGGMDTLSRAAAYHVSKAEAQMAWHRQQPPLLPPSTSRFYHGRGLTLEAQNLPDQPKRSFADDHLECFLTFPLFGIACGLQHLTRLVEIHSKTSRQVTPSMREFAEDTYARVQHSIVSFPFPCPETHDWPQYHRHNAWRVAALIYLNTAIRIKPYDKYLHSLITRLSDSLQKSDVGKFWAPHQSVYLWVIFLGYHACRGKTEQEWYASELRRLVQEEDYRSLGDMRQTLGTSLYRGSVYDATLRDLCMNGLQLSLHE